MADDITITDQTIPQGTLIKAKIPLVFQIEGEKLTSGDKTYLEMQVICTDIDHIESTRARLRYMMLDEKQKYEAGDTSDYNPT